MVPVNDASGSKHLNTLLFCNLGLQFSATKPPKRAQLKSTKDPTHLKCSPAMRCSKCIAILGRLVHNKQPDAVQVKSCSTTGLAYGYMFTRCWFLENMIGVVFSSSLVSPQKKSMTSWQFFVTFLGWLSDLLTIFTGYHPAI